jgi:hypothetical protein
LLCDNDGYTCSTFWYTYPSEDDIIFWPLPIAISDELPISVYGDVKISETPKANTFSVGVLLEYTIDGVSTKIFDSNALSQLYIKFVGKITNLAGEPILGTYNARYQEVGCDYQEFLAISSEEDGLITLIGDVTDSTQLDTLRFRLGNYYFGVS